MHHLRLLSNHTKSTLIQLETSRYKADSLVTPLRSIKLTTDFTKSADIDDIAKQVKMVAELIAAREQRGDGVNRDVFHIQMGGFDAHTDLKEVFNDKLPSLNYAIKQFW